MSKPEKPGSILGWASNIFKDASSPAAAPALSVSDEYGAVEGMGFYQTGLTIK